MLIVNVDLVPHGRAAQTKTIARIAIANVGAKSLDKEYYSYDAWISKEDPVGDRLGINNTQLDTSRDADIRVVHRRERGALALVRTILNEWDEYEDLHEAATLEAVEKKQRSYDYNENIQRS